jgi:membrane-associated phospholipid phosphatase
MGMKNYTFVDYATQGYLLVVALLVLVFHNERTPMGLYLVAAHGIMLVLIHALIRRHASRRPPGRVLDFLRYFYPILLFTGFYRETGLLHHIFFADFLDPWLIRLEAWIFGMQPSLEFMHRLPYLALSELLYAAYFSYYLMILGIGIALFIRNRTQFFHYISVVSFVFYVCYLTYIIVPVMGPRAFNGGSMGYEIPAEVLPEHIPPYPAAVQKGPFFKVMRQIYHHLEAPGAAFPSSHVTIAIVTVWFSFRYLPRIRYWHLATVILLCISTVYCRYHYVVDVVAGMMTAAVLIPIGNRLYYRFSIPSDDTRPFAEEAMVAGQPARPPAAEP